MSDAPEFFTDFTVLYDAYEYYRAYYIEKGFTYAAFLSDIAARWSIIATDGAVSFSEISSQYTLRNRAMGLLVTREDIVDEFFCQTSFDSHAAERMFDLFLHGKTTNIQPSNHIWRLSKEKQHAVTNLLNTLNLLSPKISTNEFIHLLENGACEQVYSSNHDAHFGFFIRQLRKEKVLPYNFWCRLLKHKKLRTSSGETMERHYLTQSASQPDKNSDDYKDIRDKIHKLFS